jgi:hypothetical protein
MLFVGDDWAEDHHDVHLMNDNGDRLASRRLPEGLAGIGLGSRDVVAVAVACRGQRVDREHLVSARAHQNLIWARTRHTNAVRSALREYYPAALEAFEDLADRDALAILGRAPTPADAGRLSLSKIRSAL